MPLIMCFCFLTCFKCSLMIWSSLQDRSVSWLEDVRGRTFALRLPVLRPGPQVSVSSYSLLSWRSVMALSMSCFYYTADALLLYGQNQLCDPEKTYKSRTALWGSSSVMHVLVLSQKRQRHTRGGGEYVQNTT